MKPPWNEPATALATAIKATSGWVAGPMAALNRDIIAGACPGSEFAVAARHAVLPFLPSPRACPPVPAQQFVVLVGMLGAGLGRHFQEQGTARRGTPEKAFDLPAGPEDEPFLEYFARLAERTGTGHPARDTYASLVRWNLPPSEAWCGGTRLAHLPSVFDDGAVRTYTAAPDEVRFFKLLKLSETLERGANLVLEPIYDLDPTGPEALERLDAAAACLTTLHRLNADFAALPPQDSLRPAYFMDVFRQFAVHWRLGDVPPSGALDPEAIVRDLLLGTPHSVILPALLDGERARIAAAGQRPSVIDLILARCGDSRSVAEFPVLAAAYRVLMAHARVSGTHLRLSKKYLFNPQRSRDAGGVGDTGVVSNRRGTTGMDEDDLTRLTSARRHPLLRELRSEPRPPFAAPAVQVSFVPAAADCSKEAA